MNENEEFEFRLRLEKENETKQAKDAPGYTTTALASAGAGLGGVALGAQSLIGKGIKSIGGDTVGDWLVNDAAYGKKKLAGELAPYAEENPNTAAVGKVAGEIIGTLPVGGVLGKGVGMIAPHIGRAAPAANALAQSLRTGGFTTGVKAGEVGSGVAANVLLRGLGGAGSGAASMALLDPEHVGTGAFIGGALPVAAQGFGGLAGMIGRGVRSVNRPAENKLAAKLADSLGVTPEQLISALQPGPMPQNALAGYAPTVPQILQNPVTSQLQRTLKTAGTNAIGDAERLQQEAYKAALEKIAPIGISVQDAADTAGGAIQKYAMAARSDATKRVGQAFDGIDPFGQSAIHLPFDDLVGAQSKYLGEGTFGTGGQVQAAIDKAFQVGTEKIGGVAPLKAEKGAIDLVSAVRGAGGINTISRSGKELSGEIKNLRESGLNNLVKPNKGVSIERMAERMHEQGYLPDNDPATLLNMLHDSAGGEKIYAGSGAESMYQRAMEAAQGAPQKAEIVSKAVPLSTIQNLRSSIGEAANQAKLSGSNKDAAALQEMKAAIDSRLNRAAGESVGEGEFFPKDMGDRYREALKMHADKMNKFETGPQKGIFKQGGDGQALVQGAEIPGKFFSGRRSQVEDMQSFKRLIGDQPALMDEMKRFAINEAAGTGNVSGDLTSKFTAWMRSRSGASKELFNAKEKATLKAVGDAVTNSIKTESLGRVSGSDTAQKIEALKKLGFLDSKAANILGKKIPFVGAYSDPVLKVINEKAGDKLNNNLARLLANPNDLAAALKPGTKQSNALLEWMNKNGAIGSKAAIPITADQ